MEIIPKVKAQELRIGNILMDTPVYHKDDLKLVTTILMGAIEFGFEMYGIPLTPEWLQRCGFKHDILQAEHNDIIWYGNHIGVKGMLGIVKPVDIKYVHQLQNLFFCLTYKELDIVY